ncbi:pentapeptide repeat-containing protein [uncultured Sphingomonas sp.]|uniref:pentapeptide repeat-containing protein n=1 Tax=uncultured Sphingomonas sp. TaxID=158754 RepID=UPI0035CBB042
MPHLLAMALLAVQLQPAAAPAPPPAAAAPLGGDLFPTPAPPPTSCLANAPALGSTTLPAGVIDGRTLKSPRDLERLRRKAVGVMFVKGANFSGQKFDQRKLHDICFISAKLGLTDWSKFAGTGLGFIDSDLTGAKFAGAKLPWSLLRDSTLARVDATGVDLSRSRLDGGWKGSMRGLKLDEAVLTGFRVECGLTAVDGCPLDRQDMSLKGADLTKASFWPFYFPDVDASGAVLDQTEVGLEHLGRMKGAKVTGPLVVRSRHNAAIFLPAELARMQRAFLSGAAAGGASFNCAAARTPVQRAICTAPSSELRRLDRAVAQLEAGAALPGAVPTRRGAVRRAAADTAARGAWMAERDACGLKEEDEIAPCLLPAYRGRRDALARAAGAPGWVRPDSLALFISSDAPLTPEFIRSELFQRIGPVVLDSAQARMLLRVDATGRIEAKGAALGDCRLRATGLTYDPATLVLGASGAPTVSPQPAKPRFRRVWWRGRWRFVPMAAPRPVVPAVPVLQAAGDELRVIATGAPFAQCGPNGSFVPMTRVDLPQAALANLWAES